LEFKPSCITTFGNSETLAIGTAKGKVHIVDGTNGKTTQVID